MIHNEVVGIFSFEKLSDDYLLLNVKVEKKHFVHALKKEKNCSLKNMMRVCGSEYLKDNFQVEINDKEMILNQEEITIEKDFIHLTYTIKLVTSQINKIKVVGNYMFKYNDHAILKIVFDLNEKRRNFNLKNTRRTIIAEF